MAKGGGFARVKSRVTAIVGAIPEGCVTTYGAIARRAGTTPRLVARVMATLTADESAELPWFRVVGANGVISTLKLGAVGRRQIAKLREDGIDITLRNKVANFDQVFWQPR